MNHLMLIISLLFFALMPNSMSGQNNDLVLREIMAYQENMEAEFANPETSILKAEDLKSFDGLNWFPIDLSYRVTARLERTPDERPFLMPTTTKQSVPARPRISWQISAILFFIHTRYKRIK